MTETVQNQQTRALPPIEPFIDEVRQQFKDGKDDIASIENTANEIRWATMMPSPSGW